MLDDTDSQISAAQDSRFVLIGGEKFQSPPYINWNFVAHERATIDAARKRWDNGGFPAVPGDNQEYIPLP